MSLFGKTYDDEYAKPIQLKTNNSSLFGQTYNPNIDRSAVVPSPPIAPPTIKPSPVKPSAPPPLVMQMRSSHVPEVKPNYGAAWARGTLGSVPGKLLTPLAEKIFGREFDVNTLPESNTFGEKAVGMLGHLGADLPLWLAGDMALAKPLAALAKTKPVAKAISAIPKPLIPALNTGVRAGATYGAVVAPAETLVNKEGLEGLIEREKLLPVMALGGTALHGAGQLAVKGIGKGISSAREAIRPIGVPPAPFGPPRPTYSAQRRSGLGPLKTNDTIPLEQGLKLSSTIRRTGQSNPLDDVQGAYSRPPLQAVEQLSSRSVQRGAELGPLKLRETRTPAYKARQVELNETFKDLPIGSVNTPVARKTLQSSIDESMGIGRQRGAYEGLDAFGKPLKTFKKSTDTQDAIAEISTKMTKQLNDITKSVKQADKQTPIESIRKKVKDMGGIKQVDDGIFEERRVIPNWIRNDKNGRPLDEVADTLGMTSDDLLVAINDSSYKPRNYAAEAQAIANKDPEYLELSNTLETLKSGLPGKRKLQDVAPKQKGVSVYRGFAIGEGAKDANLVKPKGIMDVIDEIKGVKSKPKQENVSMEYYTESKDVARKYADQDKEIMQSLIQGHGKAADRLFKSFYGRTPMESGTVKQFSINPKKVLDISDLGENPDSHQLINRILAAEGKPTVTYTQGENINSLKWQRYNEIERDLVASKVRDSGTLPAYSLLRNNGEKDRSANMFADWMKKNGYDSVRYAENGTKHYAIADTAGPASEFKLLLTKADVKLKPRETTPKPKPLPIQPQRTTLSGSLPVDTPLARPIKKLTPVKKERLTWTNRDGLPIEPTPARPIPKEQTLADVLASRGEGTINTSGSKAITSEINQPVQKGTNSNNSSMSPELRQLYRDHRFETGQGNFAKAQKIERAIREKTMSESVGPVGNSGSSAVEQGPIRPISQEPIRSKGLSRKMPSSFKQETTVDLEIPMVNGRADVANAVEKIRPVRSIAANIGRPRVTSSSATTRSPEPIRPQTGTPGTAESFRAKVDREPKKRRSISQILTDMRTELIDDRAPLEILERGVNEGKLASAEKSIYKQSRLFRGSPERADELIRTNLAPIIQKVEKSGKTTRDLGDYALAIHAKDVNAKGITSGFTNEEIAATIQKYGTPEMEATRKELMKINNDLLESLAEGGLIERSLVTTLKEKWPNYMSLSRSFNDDKVEFVAGISDALANVTSPLKTLKGSERKVVDPIESMIKNIYSSVSAVDRNKVASQLSGLADKDTNGIFLRRLASGEERARLNSVYAMEGGKKVYYEVQPDVYKALMNLDKESSSMLIKVFQKPASLLRAGATLTPEFSLRNPIRDIVTAFSVSNSGLNPVRDIPMALLDVIKSKQGKQTLYNQFLKDNAGYGNIISMDRKLHQEVMKDILPQKPSDKFVNIINPKSWLRVLRAIADVSESTTKLGEYRAALRSGVSRPEAAYRARDIMDFGRAGASIRETNKVIAFLNASIQGKSKIYRAIKEDPVGVTTRAFISITLPTIGAFMATKYLANDVQKERIENAPGWMTSTFWLLPVPGTNQVARIPKPFDLAPIFANLPERTLKYIYDNDPDAFEGFAKESMASMSFPVMISGLSPLVEGMTGYSFFRKGQIIPQREEGLNFSDQYDSRTTGTAKVLAKGVNTLTGGQGPFKNFGSPRIMDNTIKGLTAGLGTYATSAIDVVAETSGLAEKKNKAAKNISDKPLIRAFLVSESMSGKSAQEFYKEKDKLTKDKNSLKLESPKSRFPEEKRLKQLNSVAGEISDISKDIRKIENDERMDPLVKRDRINALIAKRNALSKKAMK